MRSTIGETGALTPKIGAALKSISRPSTSSSSGSGVIAYRSQGTDNQCTNTWTHEAVKNAHERDWSKGTYIFLYTYLAAYDLPILDSGIAD